MAAGLVALCLVGRRIVGFGVAICYACCLLRWFVVVVALEFVLRCL